MIGVWSSMIGLLGHGSFPPAVSAQRVFELHMWNIGRAAPAGHSWPDGLQVGLRACNAHAGPQVALAADTALTHPAFVDCAQDQLYTQT